MAEKREKKTSEISPLDQKTLEAIGEKVKELRKKKESNHEVFAFKNDINRVSLYRIEKGKGNFTMNTLLKVLRGLDTTPEEFFKGIK
ncbi:MAG: helix-turn-helix transcriptional regulator [Cyclobacteriaceae bacterium]